MTSSRQALVLLLLIIYGLGSGCNQEKKSTETLSEVPVIALSQVDTTVARDYVADVQSVENVEVRSRVQGYLQKSHVDEGQSVRKGQLLFQIDPTEFRIALQKAEADVASAQADARIAQVELKRVNTLVGKRVISASDADLASAKLTAAQAAVSRAQATRAAMAARLSYTSVRAPFDGIIDRIPLKTGSLITEGTLLTTISNNRQMYAYFNVSENEYLRQQKEAALYPGKEVALRLSDGTVYPLPGRIETHEGEFNDNTGSIAFRARFENPKGILRHGASGKITVRSSLRNAILIPQKAVLEIQDKSYVFRLGAGNTVRMVPFVPALRIGQYCTVASGLRAGDCIVYEGIQNLKDGAAIRPQTAPTINAQP